MKIVVDTNILFSFFKSDSFSRKLILNPFFELISPKFTLVELDKYSDLIMKKCNLSKKDFNLFLKEMKQVVKFIPQKNYSKFFTKAKEISPDVYDIDFFALCLKEKLFLWSNDELLKKQNIVNVLSTKDIVQYLL